jgi:TatD DNase family protein
VPRLSPGDVAALAAARPLVDSHCHLLLLEERGLLGEALQSAVDGGVEQIVSVGIALDDSDGNRRIAEQHPGVFFTVGWHPHEKQSPGAADMRALEELVRHPRAVAVGEVGLDRYWRPGYHEVPMDVQRRSLRAMLELAVRYDKPVVIHDRDAHAEVLEALDEVPGVRGVMHCFSGDAPFAAECIRRGFACSFAGTVTFPKSEGIQAAAASVGEEWVLVETDAPFLAPVPYRGRTNLPGYVAATCVAVARLRGVEPAVLARTTTANARRLFGLPDPAEGDVLGGTSTRTREPAEADAPSWP